MARATLAVHTYNIGLLRVFGSDKVSITEARAKWAPRELYLFAAAAHPSIILLQEVWRKGYAKDIARELAGLGYVAVSRR